MQPEDPHPHHSPVRVWPARATVVNGVVPVSLSLLNGEKTNGRMSMLTAANNNLILIDHSSLKGFAESQEEISYARFYQLIAPVLTRSRFEEQALMRLGDRLVALVEHAHAFRRMDMLERISQILLKLPLPCRFEAVGQYYRALCIHRLGRGDVERAAGLLEHVAESAPPRYRARAMQSLGTNSCRKGDYQAALSHYREAGRFASRSNIYDAYATLGSLKMTAVINGLEGNHRGAVVLLENLFPLANNVRSSQPHVYYDYMNSLAVELCEVGKLEEATNVSDIVLASPFASAYPEWRETRDEIQLRGWRPSRSAVAVTQPRAVTATRSKAQTLIRLPVSGRVHSLSAVEPPTLGKPARVLSMEEWKKRMPSQLGGDPQDRTIPRPTTDKEKQARAFELRRLDTRQMLLRLMKAIGDEDISDDQLLRALIILEGAASDENHGA
jgi:tetratricopeptide (TPR) repeat protein